MSFLYMTERRHFASNVSLRQMLNKCQAKVDQKLDEVFKKLTQPDIFENKVEKKSYGSYAKIDPIQT